MKWLIPYSVNLIIDYIPLIQRLPFLFIQTETHTTKRKKACWFYEVIEHLAIVHVLV